jgi:hypothetical protein
MTEVEYLRPVILLTAASTWAWEGLLEACAVRYIRGATWMLGDEKRLIASDDFPRSYKILYLETIINWCICGVFHGKGTLSRLENLYLLPLTTMALPLYTLIAALVAVAVYRLSRVGRRPPGYPPGPPTLPIIGNIHLMPKEKAHLQFQKWAEQYGPVYSLILGTKVMIVLSSDQAIKDLLDKRSGIYSSRPDMYLGKVLSNNLRMLLMVRLSSSFNRRGVLTLLAVRSNMANVEEDSAPISQHQSSKSIHPIPGS